MRNLALILALGAVTACGADGPPVKPSINTTVSVGSDGVRSSTGVSVTTGPVTIGGRF